MVRLKVIYDLSGAWEEWTVDVQDDNPADIAAMTNEERIAYLANASVDFLELEDSGNDLMVATEVEVVRT